MKIMMLGWEFPPLISGGLGTACFGLTRALNELGHKITFVLPRSVEPAASHVRLRTPEQLQAMASHQMFRHPEMRNVEMWAVPSTLRPYDRPSEELGEKRVAGHSTLSHQDATAPTRAVSPPDSALVHSVDPGLESMLSGHYAGDIFSEVNRYAGIAVQLANGESFDVIHAHDWMTFPAGIALAAISGKPLVVHIHSTEFDRSGETINQEIYNIERWGIHKAQKVVAVSHLTRNILINRYDVPAAKVEVVYNAIDGNGDASRLFPPIRGDEKIVLFLGRITMQKGPEYFLAAAKKVLDYEKNVRFIMAGSGDLIRMAMEMARKLGISEKVLFTGFLRGEDVNRVFQVADLYVMPSVSEPFGIAPLEALAQDVPVLISKQSGVSEILTHVLKVDFWDIDEMANKIIAVLRHPPLQATLRQHGRLEVRRLTWHVSAEGCLKVYHQAIAAMN